MRGELAHLAGLDQAAELLPQFMRPGLDHRVMGDAHDRAVGSIQGHGGLRGLVQELVEFFLECGRCPIHGSTPFVRGFGPPKLPGPAL
jgi:hypothetical protein